MNETSCEYDWNWLEKLLKYFYLIFEFESYKLQEQGVLLLLLNARMIHLMFIQKLVIYPAY